ncbi:hypothetical protein [Capillimicrobium parvum]|uniref:Uncharacterized protein n=1 Tax=Capillimicrobium parvum TaxID=2884022 RepID=A0A9E7C085_9ACTN|nr:hypothetical protein [Capillimicrobium parvum]UGS36106.1 hypothetical protein DSM104329_02506 [Capillimicrobium parvum]
MKLNTDSYAHNDLPAALLDLRAELSEGADKAPPELLGPISALLEVDYTCESVMKGRRINPGDRQCLVADLGSMHRALGPRTRAAASPELDDFVRGLSKLARRLDDAGQARSAQLTTRSLLAAMARPDVARAAWNDAVHAFESRETTPQECMYRLRVLQEICEHRGYQWHPQGLADQLVIRLGDVVARQAMADGDATIQPTPVRERLDACEARLAQTPGRADIAVWFVISHAELPDGPIDLGPVQVYPAATLRAAAEPDAALPNLATDLPEINRLRAGAGSWLRPAPDHHAMSLARVWMRDALRWRAPAVARGTLEALVEIADPGTQWVIWDGHMGWSGGDLWGESFTDPEREAQRQRLTISMFDHTQQGLQTFSGEFVQRLLDSDPNALEAVEDARWVVALSRASGHAQRVALGTRALERSLSVVQGPKQRWAEVTSRYLKARWVLDVLRQDLGDAALTAVRDMRWKAHNPTAEDDLLHLVLSGSDPTSWKVSHRGLATARATYGDQWASGSLAVRLVERADTALNDPTVALARLDELEDRFTTLLERAERQRNSLIHGGRPVDGVLATVDDFVTTLNDLVAEESMHAAETGDDPLVRLEGWRVEALHRKQRLEAAEAPVDVLFADGS